MAPKLFKFIRFGDLTHIISSNLEPWMAPKPLNVFKFGNMDGPQHPIKLISFGAMDGSKPPHKCLGFGAMDGPKTL